MRGRRGAFLWQLMRLAAVVMLPLGILLVYNLLQSAAQAKRAAYQGLADSASAIAVDAESLIASAARTLDGLAEQPALAALDAEGCGKLLGDAARIEPLFVNTVASDGTGRIVCQSAQPGDPGSIRAEEQSKPSALAGEWMIGKPRPDPASGRVVSALSRPLRNATADRSGTLSGLVDLAALKRRWERSSLPAGTALTLLDAGGTVLVRVPDFERWVGKDASQTVTDALRDNPDGIGMARGLDGVERSFARAQLPSLGLQVFASVPTETVLAGYHAERRRSLIVAALVLLATIALGVFSARRLAAPLVALAATARRVAEGDSSARADESAPGEFGQVGREFNNMLAARLGAQAVSREAERRYDDLLANIALASFTLDLEGRVVSCNDHLLKISGWRREEVLGEDWFSRFVPPERDHARDEFLAALRRGDVSRQFDGEMLARDGSRRYMHWNNSLLCTPDGAVSGFASIGEDQTDWFEAQVRERRLIDFYAALSRANTAIVREHDPHELFWEICRICVEHGHASFAHIAVVESEEARPVAWAGPAHGFMRDLRISLDPARTDGRGPIAMAILTGRHYVVNDIEADPMATPWRTRAKALGSESTAAFPIRRGGHTVGALSLHMTVKDFFDESVLKLADEMAGDISFALDNFDRERDRIEATAQAKSHAERFAKIFRVAPIAMSISTLSDGRLLDVNDAMVETTGLDRETLLARNPLQENNWPDAASRLIFLGQLRAGKTLRNYEQRLRGSGGQWRDYVLHAELMDFEGEACILTISDDVTDRRRIERELAANEAQLTSIFDTAMDAIVAIDPAGRVQRFNRAAVEMFGVAATHAVGLHIDQFIPDWPHGEAPREPADAAAAAAPLRSRTLLALTGRRADGSDFPVEAAASPRHHDGEALMTLVIRDATERRRAEEARLAQAAAESASQAKTEFLSRMSHELRTPLNAMLGFTQLLQTDTEEPLSPNQQVQIEHMRQAGWHLLALINDVLDVSRIESGRLQVELRRVELRELLDEALRMQQPAARERGIRLDLPYRDAAPTAVRADPIRLRQVVLNIVSNAMKYNRPGGSVRIDLNRNGSQVHIDVADDGVGMSPSQLAHLFEPFNRLGRESDGVEGTGIGLVLSRQLVSLMQGQIDVTSRDGVGTRVRVTLAAADADSAALDADRSGANDAPAMPPAEAIDAPPRLLNAEQPMPHGSVLYIEDNPVNVLLVEQLLARWPQLELSHAEDGESGVQRARELRPDLVLLDMRLPDMDGVEVLARLRADEATAGLRVVALSASAMPEEVSSALAAGALDYWTKPLDFGKFLSGLRDLLAGGPR